MTCAMLAVYRKDLTTVIKSEVYTVSIALVHILFAAGGCGAYI